MRYSQFHFNDVVLDLGCRTYNQTLNGFNDLIVDAHCDHLVNESVPPDLVEGLFQVDKEEIGFVSVFVLDLQPPVLGFISLENSDPVNDLDEVVLA